MSTALPRVRILVVEDHAATSQAVIKFLELNEYVAEPAFDVASALKLTTGKSYDVLICDLNLPDGTGWDLVGQLTQRGPVRAIAFSAFDAREHITRSREAGFADYVVKGSGADALIESIERVMAGEGRLLTPAAKPAARRGRSSATPKESAS